MSLISDVFAGGAEGILKGVKDIVGAFKADPLELAKLQVEVAKAEANLQVSLSTAQTKINEIEAASQDRFVAGWRPAIGWVCGGAYAYTFILQPFMVFISHFLNHPIVPPTLEMAELSMVLFGMLGLGAMRSFDKTTAAK